MMHTHWTGGNELACNSLFVRIYPDGVKDNICIKKYSGGHNIHRD